MVTNTVIQKPEMQDNSEYKINRRTREGKLLHSLLNKEQVKSAKLVKVINQFDDGRTYEKNGVHVEWETALLISMARDINNHPYRKEDDVVNVVVTEIVQTEFADEPEFIAFTTVGDEPQMFTNNENSAFSWEARKRAVITDQVEYLRLVWLRLEGYRKNHEQHEEKLAEAKANAQISEHDTYVLRQLERKLQQLEKILEQPLEATPKELIKRAKFLLMKQLFELVAENVGKPYCERTFRENRYGLDAYRIMTFNDVVAHITTDWKSSDWAHENYLDQVVIKEVLQELR